MNRVVRGAAGGCVLGIALAVAVALARHASRGTPLGSPLGSSGVGPALSTAGGAPAGVAHDSGGSPMPLRAQPPSSDEAALMTRLRAATDPALALDLAREGNRRFPDSADAPERASIEIHALAAQGRASEARETAEEMVNRYPDSPWVREVERLTGAHRHRNLRLNAQGQVESY